MKTIKATQFLKILSLPNYNHELEMSAFLVLSVSSYWLYSFNFKRQNCIHFSWIIFKIY